MLNPDLNLNQKIFEDDVEMIPIRDGFGQALLELGERRKEVIVLTADVSESTRVHRFAQKFPERFIQCGVAEQNMAGIAAGLGVSGKIVFMSSYAVFSPGKNWETIRTTIIYNNSNVKIAGHHAGIVTGPDGVTHQATEDIAITRCWPNIRILSPCDYWEAKKATTYSAEIYGPFYIRYVREKTPLITTENTPFRFGKVEYFWLPKTGSKAEIAVIATGHLVYQALLAAKLLEKEGIDMYVINLHTIKPLDGNEILKIAKEVRGIVTVEDHQIAGGMGSAVAEFLSQNSPTKIGFVGLRDTFAESGRAEDLLRKYNLDTEAIIDAVKKILIDE
ncbi:MAG: transketolase family protein [Patescibacteria group bacterium]|nr:transketolase family protein [Patescibacteria group bacterium]